MNNIDLRLGDCLDELGKIADETIDLVVTDPAYESMMRWQGIGTTARMGMGKKGSGSDNLTDKWFEVFPNDNLPDLVQEIHRVLKPERHAYIMCDWETLKILHYLAIEEGVFSPVGYGGLFEPCKPLIVTYENYDVERENLRRYIEKWLIDYAGEILDGHRDNSWTNKGFGEDADALIEYLGAAVDLETDIPLIWDKVIQGTGYTYRPRYEFILMLWKGKKRRLNNLSTPDVLQFKKPWGKSRIFPTQKPVELFKLLIEQSTQEGETVLDMFLGSGTAAKAAYETKRNFIGIEKSPKAFAIAQTEIEQFMKEKVDGITRAI